MTCPEYRNHHPVQDSGFTLIELLIGVALVGVIAAVSLPSYSNYTRRTRAMEGLGQASAQQIKIAEEPIIAKPTPDVPTLAWTVIGNPGETPNIPIETTVISVAPSPMVKNIVRVDGNNLIVNYSQNFDTQTQYALVMQGSVPSAGLPITWTCAVGTTAQTLLDRYRRGGADAGTALPVKWAPTLCKG